MFLDIYISYSYYITYPICKLKQAYSSKTDYIATDISKISKEYRQKYELTQEQIDAIIGIMLADGSLERGKPTHNTRLRIDHTYPEQESYVLKQEGKKVSKGCTEKFTYSTSIDLSRHKLIRSYSTIAITNIPVTPKFITGFTDAEGSFVLSIYKSPRYSVGWQSSAIFAIKLHARDRFILEALQVYFGGIGSIIKNEGCYIFSVKSIKELEIIIAHFNNYPLITQKRADFELFKRGVEIIKSRRHRTLEGLQEIVNHRASLNKGLTDVLKASFLETLPTTRPLVENITIPHPDWVAGFVTGEGSFYILIEKSPRSKTGFQVILNLQISQHRRDMKLLENLISFFECGRLEKKTGNPVICFIVSKFSDINEKIIPFFHQYKIVGNKFKDFQDWCKAAKIVKERKHLTKEGLDQIISIKLGMNTGRSPLS